MPDLDRFIAAQDDPAAGHARALAEIDAGGKRGHWIWYVFPQLAGLGQSAMSRRYAIADAAEARAYLAHPLLRTRLLAVATAVARQSRRGVALVDVMGSAIDAAKLVSSLTLFGWVARQVHADAGDEDCRQLATVADELLARAAAEGLAACDATRDRLGHGGRSPGVPRR